MEANRSHLSGHSAQIFKGQAFVDIDYYVIMFLNFSISVFKEAHSTKMEAGGEGVWILDSWHSWKVLAQENFNGPVINLPK